jgi:hypothetical protein
MTGETVRVLLSVRTASGQEVFHSAADIEPEIEQVNGPGCPPTVWRATVVAHGDAGMHQEMHTSG